MKAIPSERTTWARPLMAIRTEPITINMGPQHPSTHGVFRLRVTFDGEVVLDVEPVFGYLHRGTEKLAEERTYTQIVTLTDRLDYVSSMTNNPGLRQRRREAGRHSGSRARRSTSASSRRSYSE